MHKYRYFGVNTPEISQREIEHRALAHTLAAEGMVLLKNDGALPLGPKAVALYGGGSRLTVKGGRGSGQVNERHSVSIEEGLKNAGFTFPSTLWMDRFEAKYNAELDGWREDLQRLAGKYSPAKTIQMFDEIHAHPMPLPQCTPILPDELTDETDTAIYVLSRQAGEGEDRKVEKGDYLLSDMETYSLKTLSEHYKTLILVLNCGGVIDLSVLDDVRIDAVVLFGHGGMEGGNALADLLTGAATPCGKLTDTWAYSYSDYPCAGKKGKSDTDYVEGVYVGYRYFSSFGLKPRFPFGFGLSYAEFEHEVSSVCADGTTVRLTEKIKNKGSFRGKEIVQIYLVMQDTDAPKSLAAFVKTSLLMPYEEQAFSLQFDLRELALFDENESAFILPEGEYGILCGNSSDNARLCAILNISEKTVIETVRAVNPKPLGFTDITAQRFYDFDSSVPIISITNIKPREALPSEESFSDKVKAKLAELNDKEKMQLCCGGGYKLRCYNNVMGAAGRSCTRLLKKGIPNIVLSDGPAGLNVNQCIGATKLGIPTYPEGLPPDWQWGWLRKASLAFKAVSGFGKRYYHYMTAWPSATIMAQTWDPMLVKDAGIATGREMLEIGVSVWLAPGLNIHRDPLCGRNYEYYSEDPLLSGKMAAAVSLGVRSCGGVGVCIKHFACNNQEDDRTEVSANVSQRALREIYLRAFRIAVTDGKPWAVMSSYNRINGSFSCASPDLLTRVLREEWGFDGLVMTDWNASDEYSHSEAVNAGNDLIMPGSNSVLKTLESDFTAGKLNKKALDTSAARVLRMIYASDTCKDFI